jgi:hypothetical protein
MRLPGLREWPEDGMPSGWIMSGFEEVWLGVSLWGMTVTGHKWQGLPDFSYSNARRGNTDDRHLGVKV